MWMPQQIPSLASELKELGLQLDPAQFADLTGFPMGAVVQVGGCSASFVSPDGLLATNHHCVHGALQYNATPENDILRNGFLAKSRGAEVQATPDARVFVTTGIEDVTGRVLAPFRKGVSDAERARQIERRRRELISECEKTAGRSCQVASFFGGAQYLRIERMEIRDVRLVYAPPLGIGNFGDEIDNWTWPRHTGDFGFYRVYVGRDGRPADFSRENVPFKPKHWLKVSTRDLDADALVMIAGYPGTTRRHISLGEARDAFEFELGTSVRYRTMLLDALRAAGRGDRRIELANASRISSLENYQKKYAGSLHALRRGRFLQEKERSLTRMREALTPDLTARYDASLSELDALLAGFRATRERDLLYSWLYTASPMLTQADHLYRLSAQRTKPDLDRAEDYRERNRKRLQQTLKRNRRSIEPGSDRAGLRLFLQEAAKLPAGQRLEVVDRLLTAMPGADSDAKVEALLDTVYARTSIGDEAVEEAMFGESTAQLRARKDSMIELAAALREFGDAKVEREASKAGALSRLQPVILEALRTSRGGRLYPDANSTLRVGFGTVKGYQPRDAVWYSAQTDVWGVVEKDTGEAPFNSPRRLMERAVAEQFGTYADDELKAVPNSFISTNIVTNGQSGSATLNAWGELCGIAYDSNWEGVGSDYLVEPEIARTIHVDSRYMLWVMDAIDGAHELLREMGITPQFESTAGD
jgi:hypothetical protein